MTRADLLALPGKAVDAGEDRLQSVTAQPRTFDIIPSLDLLNGRVVRLTRGDFATAHDYGAPDEVLQRWNVAAGSRLHMVDLEGSRQGRPVELETIRPLLSRGFRVQVGGGVRTVEDARRLTDIGVEKIVIGTVAADSPDRLAAIAEAIGSNRIVAAVDIRDGEVRTTGWEKGSSRSVAEVFDTLRQLGVREALVTDISVDGTMLGPSFDLYRDLEQFSIAIIASGGIGIASDIAALSRISGLSGAVIGRALHEGRFTLDDARRQTRHRSIPRRIIPCLDVRGGRVVKGVRFESLRDAGDPVERAIRYEAEGADELIVLDVSATVEERNASLETIRRISENLFIPLTVGGGVRTVEDFRQLLRAGADRVAINTAAVENPQLIAQCAREFGVQAVVLAVDALRSSGFPAGARRELGDGVPAAAPPPGDSRGRPRYTGPYHTVKTGAGSTDTALDALRVERASSPVLGRGEDGRGRPSHTVRTRAGSAETALDALRVERASSPVLGRGEDGRGRPSHTVKTRAGSAETALDAVEWCIRGEQLGAGEILLTSIDCDGTGDGFDLELLRAVTSRLNIGVIASGGAGKLEHFLAAVERGGANAVLAASLFHDRKLSIGELKQYLNSKGVEVRR